MTSGTSVKRTLPSLFPRATGSIDRAGQKKNTTPENKAGPSPREEERLCGGGTGTCHLYAKARWRAHAVHYKRFCVYDY